MSEIEAASIDEMRRHLEQVLASPPFQTSPRMRNFLRFLCEEHFGGRSDMLKELVLAVEVFDKPDDFDPGTNAVVRVEAGRLRRLLARYHSEHGSGDDLILSVPKGSYAPRFERVAADDAGSGSTAVSLDPPSISLHGIDETRIVTVVACAIDGSPNDGHGDFLSRFDSAHQCCVEIAERHGGAVDANASDRLIIYFGWPDPLEDTAGRAMTAALQIVAAMNNERMHGITVRIGMAAGEVFIRARSQDQRPTIVGAVPAVATRLLADLPPNNIVVTESVRRLSGTAFELLPAGSIDSANEPAMLVWRLLRARRNVTRFRARRNALRSPVVGRAEEAALLVSRWRLAEEGEGHVLIVEGDAGIGKSRLCESVLARIPRKASQIRAQCSPHHSNRALYPVIAFLHRLIGHEDDEAGAIKAIGRLLARFDLDTSINRALLAELLFQSSVGPSTALPANRRKEATLQLLMRLLSRRVEAEPTAIFIEDVHWADPTTIELIERMIALAASSRLFLLVTSRTGFVLGQQAVVTTLRLSRLSRNASNEMIEWLVETTPIGPDARKTILERAQGVPLYLEELTKLFLSNDQNVIAAGRVPESINDLLASQLGRLGPARDVAQVAAVIGKAFSPALVSAVTNVEPGRVEAAFDQLVAAGVFVPSNQEGPHAFSFRHALLRDAAYASLLDTDRRKLHGRVGDTLVGSFADLAAEHPEVVAEHMKQAGWLERAIPFWIDAGRKASNRYELTEAIVDFRAALDALSALPSHSDKAALELETLLLLGLAVRNAHGYYEAELQPIYERARALAEDLERPDALASATYGLWTHAAGLARWPQARVLAEEFQRQVRTIDDDGQLEIEALRLIGACAAFGGDLDAARTHFENALKRYDADRHGPRFGYDPGAVSAAYLSWTLWHIGDDEGAMRSASLALDIAARARHPSTTALVLSWLLFHAVAARDPDRVIALNRDLQAICAERECRYWQPFGLACEEWARFQLDREPERLERLVANARQFTEHYLASSLRLLAADICLTLSRTEEGLGFTEEARELIENNGERIWEAEERRYSGLLKLQRDPADRAIAAEYIRSALDVARQQGAEPLARRAEDLLKDLEAEAI